MKKITLLFTVLFTIIGANLNAQIISQYIETNSGVTPKGIEIWNNTTATLDFTTNNLVIQQGTNGKALSNKVTINTGSLASGAVLVVGTSDMQTITEANGATFVEYTFTFNGDDALAVVYGGNTTDVFGTPGTDPGSEWAGSGVSTKNQNIAISDGIKTGDTDGWSDPSERFTTVSTDPVNVLDGFGTAPSTTLTSVFNTKVTSANAWAFEGKINFKATAGEKVEVYNAIGQKVVSTTANEGLNTIPVNAKGVLIVKVANKVSKVIL